MELRGRKYKFLQGGFTLMELTLVIIMLAIMSIYVLPRFFKSNGFEEYTYQNELITKLRAIQLRTMQQTSNVACQTLQIASTSIGLLATKQGANTCTVSYAGDSTTVAIDDNHNVIFTASESLTNFYFSSLGRPQGCIAKNPCTITFTVSGESDLTVMINEQGYIYAL